MTGTLHEDLWTFLIISRSILLIMRNVSGKSFRENRKDVLCFMFNNFLFPENRIVHEIMWKNVLEADRPQVIMRSMSIACRITLKNTDTHSEYVILRFQSNSVYANASQRYTYLCLSCYNGDIVCLLRGTNWVLKYNSG